MNPFCTYFFTCLLLLTAFLPKQAFCEGDDEADPNKITFQELVPLCFKAFQEAAEKPPNNFKMIISNADLFSRSPRQISTEEFQFSTAQAIGRVWLENRGPQMTVIMSRYKLKGYFGFERVRQYKMPGAIEKLKSVEYCKDLSNELTNFLKPKTKFAINDVVAKFKESFEAAFGADKKLELLETPLEHTSGSQPGEQGKELRQLSDAKHPTGFASVPERKLAATRFDRWIFQLVTADKRVIGQIDFSQVNRWMMVINVKVINQYQAKTFLSFVSSMEKSVPSIEALVAQLKEVQIVEAIQPSDLEAIIKKLMEQAQCTKPEPKIESGSSYSAVTWQKVGEYTQASDDDLNGFRTRRRLSESCPFLELKILLKLMSVDGFPSLEVYYEANTFFPTPIYLDYFLSIKSKEQIENRLIALFTKFTEVFKSTDAVRAVEQKKDDEFDAKLKEYKRKIEEDEHDSENLRMPIRESPVKWTPEQAVLEVQKRVISAHSQAGGKLNLSFMSAAVVDDKAKHILIKDGVKTLMLADVTISDTPRVKMTFFFYPNEEGERTSTYQIDFSTDTRLNQMTALESELAKYFKAPWKMTKALV